MSQSDNEELIYRIVSGEQSVTVSDETFKVVTPSNSLKLEAEKLYQNTIRENRFNSSWLSDRACLSLLVSNGLCSADIDSNLETISKSIDDLKVSLYTSLFIPDIHAKHRKQLDMVKQKQAELINVRHSMDHLTLKGFASMIKSQFLIFNTLYNSENERVWVKSEDIDIFLLEKVSYRILRNALSPQKLRELSRTEPWRGYWNIRKTDIFEGSVFDFTDEQRSIVLYSKMYDSAFEHPECPTEEVMKDDDLFDGWLISQHRRSEKDRMTKEVDQRIGKAKGSDADEVFLVAKSKEDKARIDAMNDTGAEIIKAQRKATIKKRGGMAVDSQFTDRRVDMQQQYNEMFKSRGK